jgi:hypothetical protein
MDFTPETVSKWLEEYYAAFHRNQGTADSVQRMRSYFTPDFEFWPFNRPGGNAPRQSLSLDDFIITLIHPGLHEHITPLDRVLDREKMIVTVFAQIQFTDEISNTTWPAVSAGAFMYFTFDENKALKVKKIRYFLENSPPGEAEYKELWRKYREQELQKNK